MSGFYHVSYNKSFSQLAKESSFTFNLYRGRVDWKKLEELDVDRVVRDQDVELLYLYLNNVTNCSLESEYDVKILDPNFIKLFRLAQLLIDFLLHCKSYLEHCIKVAHESLQTSNKEIEALRKQLQDRNILIKQLKKRFKDVKQNILLSPGTIGPTFECSLCGKVFMNETFLHGHHSRRHQALPHSLVLRPFNMAPASPNIVTKESEENVSKPEEITSMKKKYKEEIEDLKKLFFAEIEKLKHSNNSQKVTSNIQTQYSKEAEEKQPPVPKQQKTETNEVIDQRFDQKEDMTVNVADKKEAKTKDKIKSDSSDKNPEVGNEGEGEWLKRLEERETVWRARLSALDLQHKKQVQQLQDKLNSTQLQGQEMKKELENRLEEVLAKLDQSQRIPASQHQSLQESDAKQTLGEIKEQNKTSQVKSESKEIIQQESPKKPLPFQKRKAFVSQKTKTIQDSFEIPEAKELPENLVQVLNPEDDSELENVSTLTQNSTREKEKAVDNRITFVDSNDKNSEMSKSKNKESIIAKLLEEERLRPQKDVKMKNEEVEESTLSGSVTETESDSGEERGGSHSSDDQDQLLKEESQLAQQSLQSMEALLATNPDILQRLKADLAELASRRLHSLGVDPTWRGLPAGTYKDKVATLAHQRNITAKNHPVYFTLRDKLRKDAESAVEVRSKAQSRCSPADSLLRRLRSKAAQVISAARFTRHLGSEKTKEPSPQQNVSRLVNSKPLAASSPQLTPDSTKILDMNQGKRTSVITKVQSVDESFSLSSSTEEEDEEEVKSDVTRSQALSTLEGTSLVLHKEDKGSKSIASLKEDKAGASKVSVKGDEVSTSIASVKSALRHTVSTTNLTKKKVLFVDEALYDGKRSQSENTVIPRQSLDVSTRFSGSESVASLVQEIQQQLSNRSGKPSLSVDLMKQPDLVKSPELPLSEILPLTKSGRELLESPAKSPRIVPPRSAFSELNSSRLSEPLSQVLQKVPTKSSSTSLGKRPDLLEWPAKSQLFPRRLSPDLSVSSLGSSLLDLSASPRTPRKPLRGSLEWDLQDLEDNMKD